MMKRRGRFCTVNLEDQKEVFVKYKNYFKHEKDLPSPNDPIFSTIRVELESKMTEKALYISLKRNYYYFFEHETTEQEEYPKWEAVNDSHECSEEETEELFNDTKVFSFQLDFYKWQQIQPIAKFTVRNQLASSGKYQKKFVLPKHEWAHLLRDEIWNKTKIPCSWTFKTHTVRYGEQITCYGSCTECNAEIKIVINWPTDKIAVCEGLIMDYDINFRHNPNKKIKLVSQQRKEYSQQLKHTSSITVRNKLVDATMDIADSEPPHLPTVGCLRQIKYEDRCSEHYNKNPVLAVWIMTNTQPYDDEIKHLSLHPFYIHYWSSAQDGHYNKYIKDNRLLLSLDATGSLVKELGPTKEMITTNHIFLYSAVMYDKNNGRSVPISQMLSATHDMNTISKWLKAWVDNKNSPNEVILDQSPALIGAAVKAFTNFESTKDYITNSFNKLEEHAVTPNETYIRIDVSHLIKILANLSCFKNVDERVKSFYFRCFLLIRCLEDYNILKEVVSDMITVCLNKYDAVETRCSEAKSRLKKRLLDLKGIHINEDSQKSDEDIKDNFFNANEGMECNKETSNVPKWYTNELDRETLIISLTEGDEGDEMLHENLFYMPSLISQLTRLIKNLPLWSNIMIPIYNSDIKNPSSSNVESHFKTLKRYIFNVSTKANRLRVDELLIKHSEFIAAEMKIATNKEDQEIVTVKKERRQKSQKTKTTEYSDDSIFAENHLLIENWRGYGRKNLPKKKKCIKYIPLLLNGLKTRSGLENVTLKNTCAFDAAAQIIATACADGFAVNTTVYSNTASEFCAFIKNMLDDKKTKQDLYRNRALIAEVYFKKTFLNGITEISCECSVTKIFEDIMIDAIYSADVIENCTDESCIIKGVTRKIAFLPLNMNMKKISELNQSASSVLADNNVTLCRRNNCEGIRTFTYVLHNIINFELSQTNSICIEEVPKEMVMEGKTYSIIGIIEYVPTMTNDCDIGHYKAHCFRGNKWVCYDDMSNRTTRSQKNIIAHCILYGQK